MKLLLGPSFSEPRSSSPPSSLLSPATIRGRRRPKTTESTSISSLALLLLLAARTPMASAYDCARLQTDGHMFNFDALKGPHQVVTSVHHPPRFRNATFTLDICAPLKRHDDVKKGDECPNGSYVCGIWNIIEEEKGTNTVEDVRPIAGKIDGRELDHVSTRLSTSNNDEDKGKVGVRLLLQGGKYENKAQKAVIELLCNETLEGTEGEWKAPPSPPPPTGTNSATSTAAAGMATGLSQLPEVVAGASGSLGGGDGMVRRDGDGDGDGSSGPHQLMNPGAALIWNSYGPSVEDPNVEVLKLTWYTKHACEKRDGDGGEDPGRGGETTHWGFFTWMVILIFLATATYLIFGSWLNYNRYGARGWDLLPHGDTIRDIPYLLSDWTRRLINTVQGSGSRGGYSAV